MSLELTKKEEHIIKLSKTKTLAEIKEYYPDLLTHVYSKIIAKELLIFKTLKNENNGKRTQTYSRHYPSQLFNFHLEEPQDLTEY